jgi:hypothetical protein
MLFKLSEQNFPDAIHTSAIPEEYADIALSDHTADVPIAARCTLIHHAINENGYSLAVNNFFPALSHSLYHIDKVKGIPVKECSFLREYHFDIAL